MIGGKGRVGVQIWQCGHRLRSFSLCGSGARVFIAVCDLVGALEAGIWGLQVAAIERVVSEMDVSVPPHLKFQHHHFEPLQDGLPKTSGKSRERFADVHGSATPRPPQTMRPAATSPEEPSVAASGDVILPRRPSSSLLRPRARLSTLSSKLG